jgi:hypothetical protein
VKASKGAAVIRRFRAVSAQSAFEPGPGGGYLFFPHGVWGHGYAVDAAQRAALESRMNRFYFWTAMLLMLLVLAGLPLSVKLLPQFPRLGAAIAAFAVMLVGGFFTVVAYYFFMRPALAGLPRAEERRGLRDIQLARARRLSAFRLGFGAAGSALMLVVTAFALRRGIAAGSVQTVALGGLGLAGFAFTAWLNLHALWLKRTAG